jgi:NAD(P)-dependent dehydrogenase (short-subunit alcohol dehydrogenase family)
VNPFSLVGRAALVTARRAGSVPRPHEHWIAPARESRSPGAALATSTMSPALDHDPVAIVGDLHDADAPPAFAAQALAALGAVEVLVNNAAAAARLDTVDTDAALVDEMLAANMRAPLLLIGALVPSMTERGGGSIVNVSSVSGVVGTPRRAAPRTRRRRVRSTR